jgi:hypothetical protein
VYKIGKATDRRLGGPGAMAIDVHVLELRESDRSALMRCKDLLQMQILIIKCFEKEFR